MTIHELLALTGLTGSDEIPVWDAEASGEPTKKITAQNFAAAIKTLASLLGTGDVVNNLTSTATDKPGSANMLRELNNKIRDIRIFDKTVTIPDNGPVDIDIYSETGGDAPIGALVKMGSTYQLPYFSENTSTYIEIVSPYIMRIRNNVSGWGSQTLHIILFFT